MAIGPAQSQFDDAVSVSTTPPDGEAMPTVEPLAIAELTARVVSDEAVLEPGRFGPRGILVGLLSERTLHALLGLGAFLVLAAGAVISILNPTGLGPLLHTFVILVTALLFYTAGQFVRERLGRAAAFR